jgi:hypothetical protein
MNTVQQDNLSMELERYVDKYGLKLVIEALSEIAHDKAAHIAENWQDIALAKVWTKRGNLLNNVSSRFDDDGAPK